MKKFVNFFPFVCLLALFIIFCYAHYEREISDSQVYTALAAKMRDLGLTKISVNKLQINNVNYGMRYHDLNPVLKTYLVVERLNFKVKLKYLGLNSGDQAGVLKMKQELVIAKIFSPNYPNIVVQNVIVNEINYGPFILSA